MNGFVSGHSAVAAALATAAAPYLSRRLRRVAWALALTVGLARVYVGAHLPLDVVGGLLVGWVTGSLVHHALGVPRWEPAASHVADLLDRFGLPAAELRPAGVPARSSHPFVATGPGGRPLFVKVLDPDPLDRDWLYRGARLLVVGDVKDFGALAPLGRQAADEAVAAMTARERGVRVPAVLLARGTDGRALVVQERVDGRSLQELPPEELTGALLRASGRRSRSSARRTSPTAISSPPTCSTTPPATRGSWTSATRRREQTTTPSPVTSPSS